MGRVREGADREGKRETRTGVTRTKMERELDSGCYGGLTGERKTKKKKLDVAVVPRELERKR